MRGSQDFQGTMFSDINLERALETANIAAQTPLSRPKRRNQGMQRV